MKGAAGAKNKELKGKNPSPKKVKAKNNEDIMSLEDTNVKENTKGTYMTTMSTRAAKKKVSIQVQEEKSEEEKSEDESSDDDDFAYLR